MKTKISSIAAKLCVLLLALALCTGVLRTQPVTEEEIIASIEAGLAWLAGEQNVTDGSWGNCLGRTGLAVLKFEDYARELGMSPFDDDYIYRENVIGGLDYIFSNVHTTTLPVQNAGDPDPDDDGGVYWGSPGYSIYYTGISMMAIAGSKDPDRVDDSGGACNGWTYQDVLQDAVDFMAYAQSDNHCTSRGGWFYYALNNSCASDNSNAGYAVLGLAYARAAPFNCTIPDWVLSELSLYCDWIQTDSGTYAGGSGYTRPDYWVNTLKTGNLLFEMRLAGDEKDTSRVQDALDYIEAHWYDTTLIEGWGWNDPSGPSVAQYQAAYCLMKGLEYMNIELDEMDGITDWYQDLADVIVPQQHVDGYWPSSPCYVWNTGSYGTSSGTILSTIWALLTLERFAPELEQPMECFGVNHLKIGTEPPKCKGIALMEVTSSEGVFTYEPEPGKDKLKSNTVVDDGVNGKVKIHTSCSKPIEIGDVHGEGAYTITDLVKIPDDNPKVDIKGTFVTTEPIDLEVDDVTYTIEDGLDYTLTFSIPAGSFEVDGLPEKQKFKFQTPEGIEPGIKAKFDLGKCKFDLKVQKVQDALEITGVSMIVELQIGMNVGEETVEVEVKSKHLDYKKKPKLECCPKCKGISLMEVTSDEGVFVFLPEPGKTKLKANTIVDDGVNGPVKIHTSCSKPIEIGDVHGDGAYIITNLVKIFD